MAVRVARAVGIRKTVKPKTKQERSAQRAAVRSVSNRSKKKIRHGRQHV